MFCIQKIYPDYVSKHNSNREKQVFLIIPNGEGQYYLGVKTLLALLKGIASKHNGNFYYLNYFIILQQKTNVNLTKTYIKLKTFVTLKKDTKILEFSQYQISDKAPLVIYADLECLVENIDGCKTNPGNSSTTKVVKYIPSDFSTSIIL